MPSKPQLLGTSCNVGHDAKRSDGGKVDATPDLVRPTPTPSTACQHQGRLHLPAELAHEASTLNILREGQEAYHP